MTRVYIGLLRATIEEPFGRLLKNACSHSMSLPPHEPTRKCEFKMSMLTGKEDATSSNKCFSYFFFFIINKKLFFLV
jgi:hypothetical protein